MGRRGDDLAARVNRGTGVVDHTCCNLDGRSNLGLNIPSVRLDVP